MAVLARSGQLGQHQGREGKEMGVLALHPRAGDFQLHRLPVHSHQPEGDAAQPVGRSQARARLATSTMAFRSLRQRALYTRTERRPVCARICAPRWQEQSTSCYVGVDRCATLPPRDCTPRGRPVPAKEGRPRHLGCPECAVLLTAQIEPTCRGTYAQEARCD